MRSKQRAPDGFSNIDDVLSFEQRKAIVRGYAVDGGLRPQARSTSRPGKAHRHPCESRICIG